MDNAVRLVMSGHKLGHRKDLIAWTARLLAVLRSNGSTNGSHGDKSSCKTKANFHKSCSLPSLAQRLQDGVLAKLYTWETRKERKFLTSCHSVLLCIYNRWRGLTPTYRTRLFASCAPPPHCLNSCSPCPTFCPSTLCSVGKDWFSLIFTALRVPFCLVHCF
jgi:hypothetical protein